MILIHVQGPGNDFYPGGGGGGLIRKMKFCLLWKISLYKISILGGARPSWSQEPVQVGIILDHGSQTYCEVSNVRGYNRWIFQFKSIWREKNSIPETEIKNFFSNWSHEKIDVQFQFRFRKRKRKWKLKDFWIFKFCMRWDSKNFSDFFMICSAHWACRFLAAQCLSSRQSAVK